jgi:hypothetical protein
LQRTKEWFPPLTWWLRAIYSFSSRRPDALFFQPFELLDACHTQTYTYTLKIKSLRHITNSHADDQNSLLDVRKGK